MLHSEGNIQHIVYQSKGSITTDIICNRVQTSNILNNYM